MMKKLKCDVCGALEEQSHIEVHSAMNIPVSLCYCENCDKFGYVTHWELIKYLSYPHNKEKIMKNIDFIIENCQAIREGQHL